MKQETGDRGLEFWRIHVEKTVSKVNQPLRNSYANFLSRGAEEELGFEAKNLLVNTERCFPILAPDS
jgi:hypothetical protein